LYQFIVRKCGERVTRCQVEDIRTSELEKLRATDLWRRNLVGAVEATRVSSTKQRGEKVFA
jgi:hypothetical protein